MLCFSLLPARLWAFPLTHGDPLGMYEGRPPARHGLQPSACFPRLASTATGPCLLSAWLGP